MPKRKKKSAGRRRPLLRLSFFFFITASISLFVAFLWIDSKVVKTLSTRGNSKAPLSAVYGAPVRISHLDKVKKQTLLSYLLKRNYRETQEEPKIPGEYRVTPEEVTIYTRSYTWTNGRKYPETLTKASLTDDVISAVHNTGTSQKFLTLEPSVIASLSDTEYRASNYKKLAEIPSVMKNAILAIEDERFYRHYGVDPVALMRAIVTNISSMEFAQGGSTLTQQLAKNTLFTPRKTFGRKFMEILAAFSLEKHLSKEQILEMYLNEIYLGQEGSFAIHGVAEACQSFFGKDIKDITTAEAALLAGIIRAPSVYAPRRHLDRALKRKDLALEKMKALNFINEKEFTAAKEQKIDIITEAKNKRSAPYFVTALEQELSQHFNIEAASQSGINIYTGLNSEMQSCAESALGNGMEEIEKKFPRLKKKESPLEAALVAIEPQSGLVRAWVGGRDYSENQFNHVNQAVRQIGSTIKPFLYLTALDSSLNTYKTATVTSVLSDEPMQIEQVNQDTWEPENYDRTYHGDVTLRYALENSLNLPAVYIAQKVGIQNFANTLKKFQLSDQIQAVPALALGAADTTLLRLTGAYAALANGGIFISPRLFITTEEVDGTILAQSDIQEATVANEAPVFVLTDILKGVIQRGTAGTIRALGYKAPAAGKTGTSNDTRDGWFVGFTPTLSTGVWVGYDDNKKIGLTGGVLAAPIWAKFMQCINDVNPPVEFIPPKGVLTVEIDSASLERAGPGCPQSSIVREIYVKGTEPQKICRRHNETEYDAEEPDYSTNEQREFKTKKREKSFWDKLFE